MGDCWILYSFVIILSENENVDIKMLSESISGFSSMLSKLQIVQPDINFISEDELKGSTRPEK